MPRKPRISVAATTGLIEAIEAAGGRPDQILRSVGLDAVAIADPHQFIACADFTRLLEAAAISTGDDCFGLHFGEHFSPKDIGPLAYVVLNSPTFAAGFENIARYLRVYNEGINVSFVLEGERGYVRHRLIEPALEETRQHDEYSATVGLNIMRLMAGSGWAPVEMQFAHRAPRDTSEHVRVFAAPVSFGNPINTFVVERTFAERPVPAADERLYPILRRYLDNVLAEMPAGDDLLASVRRVVVETMRDGDPSLARVAGKLAMSARTLQRRLRDAATDFKRVVDDTRRRSAIGYLKDPRHTMTEIAYLLGYSEVSAFSRAFNRWTASTPSNYRRKADPDS